MASGRLTVGVVVTTGRVGVTVNALAEGGDAAARAARQSRVAAAQN